MTNQEKLDKISEAMKVLNSLSLSAVTDKHVLHEVEHQRQAWLLQLHTAKMSSATQLAIDEASQLAHSIILFIKE